jgi:hypothetical protein
MPCCPTSPAHARNHVSWSATHMPGKQRCRQILMPTVCCSLFTGVPLRLHALCPPSPANAHAPRHIYKLPKHKSTNPEEIRMINPHSRVLVSHTHAWDPCGAQQVAPASLSGHLHGPAQARAQHAWRGAAQARQPAHVTQPTAAIWVAGHAVATHVHLHRLQQSATSRRRSVRSGEACSDVCRQAGTLAPCYGPAGHCSPAGTTCGDACTFCMHGACHASSASASTIKGSLALPAALQLLRVGMDTHSACMMHAMQAVPVHHHSALPAACRHSCTYTSSTDQDSCCATQPKHLAAAGARSCWRCTALCH